MNRLRFFAKWTLAGVFAAMVLLYAGDYLLLRYKMRNPASGGAFGSVRMQQMYAVPQKDGKAEIYFGDAETDTCVHSIFPHFGYAPCWYLNRKKNQALVMVILPR
ncbi:MAG: hypothetical protein ACLP1Y_08870 [Candidatus Acidiferrales bacterium]